MSEQLPPLPAPNIARGGFPDLFTAEQMQAYARAAIEARAAVPAGWVPLTITHDGDSPEEVAFGPKRMMDRLEKWLTRYFSMLAAASQPVAQPSECTTPRACEYEGCRGACTQAKPEQAAQQERQPMTLREIADATHEWAHVRSDYTIGIVRAVERHHGITASPKPKD